MLARWLAQLTASDFNQLGQYASLASSPSNRGVTAMHNLQFSFLIMAESPLMILNCSYPTHGLNA